MKIVSIYKHLKSRKYYIDLFNEIVESGAKRYEETAMSLATSPTPRALEEMKALLIEKSKEDRDGVLTDMGIQYRKIDFGEGLVPELKKILIEIG